VLTYVASAPRTSPPGALRILPLVPVATAGLTATTLLLVLGACAPSVRYTLVEQSLSAGDAARADAVLERAQSEYGSKSQVQYWMDRGMTLHLAGRYQESNELLQQAEDEIERLYTRRIRTEVKAFLVNDTELPYEGEPYEQVAVNVLKALNYALLGQWEDALVEARRVDHRLNVLADRTADKGGYRDDGFARYVTGLLYEATGDLNNAFIAVRRAYEAYGTNQAWVKAPAPTSLRAALLRLSDALHLSQEHEEYRRQFPETVWRSVSEERGFAHLIVISYNGRAPRKEDQFIDLPLSADALKLVLLTKGVTATGGRDSRAAESVLYGLSGQVVRVALPRLVPQKTQVVAQDISLAAAGGTFSATAELGQNFTTLAEKSLNDRFATLAMKATARAAVKYSLAEGAGHGARAAAGKDSGPLIGLLVSMLAKMVAVASEEADKRSWRTLPDEVRIARLSVPPGEYEVRIQSRSSTGQPVGHAVARTVHLNGGETRFLTQRVVP
jgi:hypothetical protein